LENDTDVMLSLSHRHVRKIFVAPHHSTEELERRYKAANDGIERGHLHIIWLLSQGSSGF
jgi:hypothetical protein